MSASAVKSTMPGVGTSPTTTSHSLLPMNTMAQKVIPGTDTSAVKPVSSSGLSYVTLQPPNQPLSLVQDHRPPVYQPQTYSTSNAEKEADTDKVVSNGVEGLKVESEPETSVTSKQSESNRNNNISPDNSNEEQQQQEPSPEAGITSIEYPAACTQVQSKNEEKKPSINNGSKEPAEGVPVSTTVTAKIHKPEDSQAKADTAQKSKPSTVNLKPTGEGGASAAPATNISPKPETRVAGSPKPSKRKSRELKDLKNTASEADGASKPKRNRVQTQPYQSPLPEIALLVKSLKPPSTKTSDDNKLIVFYKNEFLAVRNAEGSFYVCQSMQNVYKSSRRIRIRWLSQDKNNGEIYSPDFYDHIDFDCILTNLNLNRIDKNKFQLTKIELLRTENILKRAIDVEAGVSEKPRVTEEHPDGLDLSLYKDESQLKKRTSHSVKQKQGQRKRLKQTASTSEDENPEEEQEKKSPKQSRSRKQSVNKALAIAKSVAKGPSRAERAMNRSTKSGIGANEASSGTADTTKSISDIKRTESKKSAKQPNNNNANNVSRSKVRGIAQSTQQSTTTAGRPKRVAATTGITSSTEDTSSRKKPRGRA